MRHPMIVLVLGLGLVGCGPAPEGPKTFSGINTQILQPSCAAFSSCHSTAGQSSAGKLNLMVDPYTALVGAASDNAKAKAEGKLRVTPGDAANSFLVIKLALTSTTTGYGDPMPQNNPNIPKEQLDGIKAWIAAGAPNN
jgi:hypothetical protein